MKNTIQIITGKQGSGKSFLAKKMALQFDNVSFINGRDKINHFSFNEIYEETDLIIIDDVHFDNLRGYVNLLYDNELIINRRHFPIEKIKTPRVIIITDKSINEIVSDSMLTRCSFIETSVDIVSGRNVFNTKVIC
ncbi:hypothetical protein AUW17_05285 [Tenacibaculum dicentrarchi]|nr:hypothetical protein AUW17_03150 [Tenacibaculum dicentrarchi]ALU74717.1 hypothetical protein AUW17_05285 [Tenacibaculum dicentrarchi]